MRDKFGLEIDPCSRGEHFTCKEYRENSSAYCSSIYWQDFKVGKLEAECFACVKYPNDP